MTPAEIFAAWLEEIGCEPPELQVRVLEEKENSRAAVLEHITNLVVDHLIGADVLSRLKFDLTAAYIREHLPTSKQIQSGDVAEIIASEYVECHSEFLLPLKRLRYKDDRNTSMRGNDLVAIDTAVNPHRILKGEVKSRAALGDKTLDEACAALTADDHRPKAATLAFLSRILRQHNRDEEAEIVERFLGTNYNHDRVTHLVFVFCGNDPRDKLLAKAGPVLPIKDRRLVGIRVRDHQEFISSLFKVLDGREN